ncbi:MAG: SDR family NAD(P)-dependent oxidoreductase [Acidimicrobiales bacterium]
MVATGTSKGIGRAVAMHYLHAGWIVIGASRGPGSIESACYHHHSVDVRDEGSVKQMFTATRRRFGRVDALVNNAGIASMNHTLLTPVETVKRITDTNVTGTFLCSREAAKMMRRRLFGRIVNFASVAVPLAVEGESAYAASKAAVITLSRVLARELGPHGITVNVVGPGPVRTDMTSSIPEEKLEQLLARLPLAQYTKIRDITNVIDFFLRPESDAVTGQVVYLGGA